jgi:predicted Fe-Mo cluster-binding NifX family protein
MKTVITATKDNVDAAFDLRFGRAAWFCIYDHATGQTQFMENGYATADSGAGTKAAEKMVVVGAEKIISGDFGPKAKDLLNKFGIQMVVLPDEQKTVKEIIEILKDA